MNKPFNTRSARRARLEWVELLAEMMDFGSRLERAYDKLGCTHGDEYIRSAIDGMEIKQLIDKFYIIEQYSDTFFTDVSPRVARAVREAIASAVNEDAAKAKPVASGAA